MKRNMIKMIEEGKRLVEKTSRNDISSDEMIDIDKLTNGNKFFLIQKAYYLGLSAGYRARKREEKLVQKDK